MNLVDLDTSRKYDFSNESDAHRITKELVYRELKEHDNLDELYFNIEHSMTDNTVADIGGYYNGKLLAVEIVHTHESYEEYCKKVDAYHKEQIYDFWIFTEECLRKKFHGKSEISMMMVDLQKRFSRIYYYDKNRNQLRAVMCKLKDGQWKWIRLPMPFKLSFNDLALAESKYQRYICKEVQYELDYNVAETEEFIQYHETILDEYVETQHPSKPEKVFPKEFRFVEGKPVHVKLIECVIHPNFDDGVCIVEIGGEKRWVRKHTGLMYLFDRCGKDVKVTLESKPNPEQGIRYYRYSGEAWV